MEKKRVFVLGDSISIHYSPFLEKMISSKFKYQQKDQVIDALKDLDKPNGANAGDSNMVLEYLRDEEKKGVYYDILLVNCGLHDIRVDRNANQIQTEKERYEENLKQICEVTLKMSQRMFWITTTPVIDIIHNRRSEGFLRYGKDVELYNHLAEKIMDNLQIPIIDLFLFTSSLGNNIYYDHVHFTEEVRALQAAFISGYLFSIG
ncbi:GDSL-like Lipase/Acylhydrolase [Desulfosporosinus acidiphilus SJ4]|uniref:GDSL-like Lipase/Acylhydrolase n=1 Tax=Desulfosporosinus acidiphilus (strain DSM 22704 / JCM 16185 / SJ4) TaxID=646529 RepID=I4D6U1_DESAJ|nr:SGNH/GDSL hydrolase family protein [Desulfosporosinus acidiphilus]AFM41515.1 GDSL-like Lipase/Acylhydrolase [Desulfosporosinus acidiphilus SJ4]